jgi:DNA primase
MTSGHANLLKRFTKEVYLCFDSDGAGIKAALRALPILKEFGFSVKVISLKPYKDPDEFIKGLGGEAFQERIDQAQNSFLYEISVMEGEYQLGDPESKTAFFNRVALKILEFEQELERENYMEAVARRYGVGFAQFRALVHHMGTQAEVRTAHTPLKSGVQPKKTNVDGMKQSQKILLTWLVQDDRLFDLIKPYIGAEDFTEPIYREVAARLFAQHAEGDVNPAKIVSMFQEEEQQREAASLFHAKIGAYGDSQELGDEKALKETIVRIKQNSIDSKSKSLEPTDLAGLQELLADKRKLEDLRKWNLHISTN